MKYLYRGTDIDTITDIEVLRTAYRKVVDQLEADRRFYRGNLELEKLFEETAYTPAEWKAHVKAGGQ